jgi:hypothetical protein
MEHFDHAQISTEVTLCFVKILCALKMDAIPCRDGCPIQVIPSSPSAKNLSAGEPPRGVHVYIKKGGTRAFLRRYVGSD